MDPFDSDSRIRCPYCDRSQAPGSRAQGSTLEPGGNDLWRCGGCNFYICTDWLVEDADAVELDDQHAVLCPWCGYPVALRQAPPADAEFGCPGCSGTLIADMLICSRALRVDREQGRRNRSLILLAMIAAFIAFLLLGAFLG